MSALRFEGNAEQRQAQAEMVLVDLHRSIRGNGNPGLERNFERMYTKLEQLIERLDTQQKEREAYRKQRADEEEERFRREKAQMTRFGILLTVCLVLLGALTAFISYREAKNHSLFPISSISSQQDATATIPNLERNLYAHGKSASGQARHRPNLPTA